MIRRLHSLAGVVFGGYIVVHLAVNASGFSPRVYQLNVDRIHSLEPTLPLIEIAAIFAPLLLHMLYGVYIAWFGVKYNTMKYNYGGNVRYTLQRWTSVILVVFILFHIATLHKWGFHLVYQITHLKALEGYAAMGLFNAHNQAFQTTVEGIRYCWNDQSPANPGNIAVMALYLLGVWAAVFHCINGMWTGAIAWGLTVTANAQRRWGHVCLALGIALFVVGTAAWAAFTIAPAAQGNLSRWDNSTLTLPTESAPAPAAPAEPLSATSGSARP
jgi:succinate dehydrogenase / fumarate reductase cytochrome b subunit